MKCNQIICENNHTHKFQDGKKTNLEKFLLSSVFFSQLKLLLMIDILRVIWASNEIGV